MSRRSFVEHVVRVCSECAPTDTPCDRVLASVQCVARPSPPVDSNHRQLLRRLPHGLPRHGAPSRGFSGRRHSSSSLSSPSFSSRDTPCRLRRPRQLSRPCRPRPPRPFSHPLPPCRKPQPSTTCSSPLPKTELSFKMPSTSFSHR